MLEEVSFFSSRAVFRYGYGRNKCADGFYHSIVSSVTKFFDVFLMLWSLFYRWSLGPCFGPLMRVGEC